LQPYDYVIVGGGTAGCVLASRLSEDPATRVLLLEAGEDLVPGREPAAIRDPFPSSYGDPQYAWPQLRAEVGVRKSGGGPRFSRPYVQGRIMGGSSSIMGMMAQRGLPADFDEWAAMGADGWDWDGVLPYFNRLETDWDFAGPLHGLQGPIPIRRIPRANWGPFSKAIADALERQGHPWVPDLNGAPLDGVSAVPMNNTPEARVSAASAYLGTKVRRRANLRVVPGAEVWRLIFEGGRVTGVEAKSASGDRFLAGETLLCAGALHTPAVLLRSGLGPALELAAAGIRPVRDLPGVGKNLANHPTVHLATHLPPHGMQAGGERTWAQAILRYSSGHAGCAAGDMLLFPANKSSWHPLGSRIGVLGICVYKSYSRGDVRLDEVTPGASPRVRFNLLDDPRDFERMVLGLKFALELLADPKVAAVRNELFLPPGGQANSLNRPSPVNWCKSVAISALFAAAPLRQRALGRLLIDPLATAKDETELRRIVEAAAAPVHHVCGTARIGRADDPEAVIDARCRVRGVGGLRVVDASAMPSIVSANTHLTVLMIAEKAAEMIKEDAAR